MSNNKSFFIVLEGGEGGGKTTQIEFLKKYLEQQGLSVLTTKEPGGGKIEKEIRSILLDPAHYGRISFRTEFLLYEADRAQHVDFTISPALAEGKTVISDRYDVASFVYQHFTRKVCTREEFDFINNFATRGLKPDLIFVFDLDPSIGLSRVKSSREFDRIEKENLEFHQEIRQGFSLYCSEHPDICCQIDASLSPEDIFSLIKKRVDQLLIL